MTHVAVLMTSHNRNQLTTASIASIRPAVGDNIRISVVLTDAGSTDGTADAVRALPLDVTVLERDSNIYWNAGMRESWTFALSLNADFYLWLNDDLTLLPHSISALIDTYDHFATKRQGRVIIVGETLSEPAGVTTYGGYKHASAFSRISFRRLRDDEIECDTMNGNCVLIPACAVKDIGLNSRYFSHGFGDIDYGLRANKAGYLLLRCSNPVGYQDHNNGHIYSGATLSPTLRNIKWVFSHPKGMPVGEWFRFCYTHCGPIWPINFTLRYLRIFFG